MEEDNKLENEGPKRRDLLPLDEMQSVSMHNTF